MPRKAKTTESTGTGERRGRYVEIVNWRAAQLNIPEKDALWVKLYTSLLDNDAFQGLDDRARMLIIALWLYAGHSGRHVFPADPHWLRRNIPMLNSDPDLRPLLEARDAYGEPKPFIRIVDKEGIYNVQNRQRVEKRREETKTETKTKPTRASGKRKKREEERVSARSQDSQNQIEKKKPEPENTIQTEGKTLTQTQEQTTLEPVSPQNPRKSEAGGAACVHTPKPPRPALRPDAYRLGKIPIWWSDPACTAFSYAIFEALQFPMDPESRQGKSERGTFASWLFAARSQTAMSRWPEIEAHGLMKAREIAQYGKSARKRGAVWLDVMHKVLPPARAGPGTATG